MSKRQIMLDTETTGLSHEQGHRVIEIGCVELISRKVTKNNFHVYLHPDRDIDYGAQKVHGISLDFLKDKPRFAQVVDEFLGFIEGAELVIHNASFDVGFLESELRHVNASIKTLSSICTITDTLIMAREMHPGQKNSLDALCKRYKVDNSNRQYHGALLDSLLLAEVYLAMTGGQSSLGLDEDVVVSSEQTIVDKLAAKNIKEVLVQPLTEEEKQKHFAYLKEVLKRTDVVSN